MRFDIKDLQTIFQQTFGKEYRTHLEYGADEPFYKAATDTHDFHTIYCREDFFASALHEIAHWCIAGKARRKLNDYGFWYSPDGRDAKEQLLFEKVEIKPQAIEKAFSIACGYQFKVSVDNLGLEDHDPGNFISNINMQYEAYLRTGFPRRANLFIQVLKEFYA